HPNIAKVLDAGATESGRPFFVMELVKGIPITRYCDEARLTTRQRLDVFMPVCQAIQHAHQKGVIHRDLKPSNILVTLHDGRPVPKVIDFGIAKAVEGRLTDATLFTSFEQFIGTPAYMSPEQAQLSGLDIDTRSDIYSLGVLLYELLTGRTPFDARELLASGLDAMRRTIREVEPPRPSTRLSTLQGEALTATAQAHGTDGLKLAGGVRGDLDWIVMKCLEKDRARRYETASGLVSDIQRHLRHEPIVARPPSPAYRLQKAVRRNKLAFAAAGAVVLALAAGLAAALWQGQQKTRAYREARAAEAAARLEAEKSRQVVGLFRKIFGGMKHSVALGRDTSLIRERAEEMVSELHRQPDLAPEVSVELRANLATIYHVTGQHARAEALHRETLPRLRAQAQARPLDLTAALRDFACVLQHVNKLAEAETNALEALRRSRELDA
ncbi:MAG TPA: serine/threonine-protein kinase, partial [Verrucomicrobiota bacterium]|nr:serine/threonine-protein kinase [Verrucomicrobiota bacterium]